MTPGVASVCAGTVYHRRATPTEHSFEYPMSMVWIDPDHPNDLCHHHRLYSPAEPAPARFRRSDYGDERTPPLGLLVRDDLEPVLGHRPDGPIRMLTQLRRFGWLFNPITVYLAWDTTDPEPVGAVLEVTNTPWHERHRYTIALHDAAPAGPGPRLIDLPEGNDAPIMRTARFPKSLHVSPFFGQDYDYLIGVAAGEQLRIDLQLVDPTNETVALDTSLQLDRTPASRRALARNLWSAPLSTYRVSTGIHSQAARLAAKRVPFVRHPDKLTQESPS
ncbi:MAG: DUF1365 domain-containing protein [Acidimicrobiales bacterium]